MYFSPNINLYFLSSVAFLPFALHIHILSSLYLKSSDI